MKLTQIPQLIAKELQVRPQQVNAVIDLLDNSNTVPFIARYRKEMTGELNEEQIRTVEARTAYLRNLLQRKQDILRSIEDQGKLTDELTAAIEAAAILQELEDLYLPYRQKKRTRASIARDLGLEPLADIITAQLLQSGNPLELAAAYVKDDAPNTPEKALQGAMDIIAENVADRADFRHQLRDLLWKHAKITTELTDVEDAEKIMLNYADYEEPISRIPSHRILAINRGENKKLLKVTLSAPHDTYVAKLIDQTIKQPSIFSALLSDAVTDSYKRLIFPSLEREIRTSLTEKADTQAISIFATNLRQLLLQPPLVGHVIMGLDPGYRTGCKMAVINEMGEVLAIGTYYLTHSAPQKEQSAKDLAAIINKHHITLLSIGNGTASYETEQFVSAMIDQYKLDCHYLITNEAGASVYSASRLAKDELPDLDVSIRGAVSIARRIQDPLAESVKIDPQSIGVGQYQHDVNQKTLSNTLDAVVESVVNYVGVELNTASSALLQHVSGISAAVAKNILSYRNENGAFQNRKELLKVSRLGPAAFTQCAGFLRIQNGKNPLDNTPVHCESYALAEQIIKFYGFTLQDLTNKDKLQELQHKIQLNAAEKLSERLDAGVPTVRDILEALRKPGRDPREELPLPLTRKSTVHLEDIQVGTVVRGTVHNVVDFGAFIDFGLKTNGLIHRSELSAKYFRHPTDIIEVGDIIDAIIISVDPKRNRIGLSIKQLQAQEKKES